MAVKDYKTNPDENTTISGINIAEGCPPSGINNAIRQLMADVKVDHDAQESTNTELAKVMTGATASAAGTSGNVPAPRAGQNNFFLRGDGTWARSLSAGSVIAFAANAAPGGGFIYCNGSAVSRTTYAGLFAAIGTTYGAGDGSTTFNLPNLNDKFIQGNAKAGKVKSAGLPNATGTFGYVAVGNNTGGNTSGVFSYSWENQTNALGETTAARAKFTFNLSKVSSIYGASTTVQPPALTMRYYIKY